MLHELVYEGLLEVKGVGGRVEYNGLHLGCGGCERQSSEVVVGWLVMRLKIVTVMIVVMITLCK